MYIPLSPSSFPNNTHLRIVHSACDTFVGTPLP